MSQRKESCEIEEEKIDKPNFVDQFVFETNSSKLINDLKFTPVNESDFV